MARDEKIFTLRIESRILEHLRKRAEANKRSMAKEIEFILEETLQNDESIKKTVLRLAREMRDSIRAPYTDEDLLKQEEVMCRCYPYFADEIRAAIKRK